MSVRLTRYRRFDRSEIEFPTTTSCPNGCDQHWSLELYPVANQMTVIQAVRRGTCRQAFLALICDSWTLFVANISFWRRLLLTQSRGVSQTSNATSGRSVTSMSHASLCQHAPGSCILCKQTLTGLRFNTTDTSKDQKQSSPSGSTGEKESDSSGTDGGMMVRHGLYLAGSLLTLSV